MENWDVIVVGAGLTGLSVGAMLADSGKKVLIVEKNGHIGGRMKGAEFENHILDNGAHVPSYAGHLEEIWERLSMDFPERHDVTGSEIYRNGKWINYVELCDRKALRRILEEIGSTSYEDLDKTFDIPLRDWLSARSNDQGVHDWFDAMAIGTFAGHTIEAVSASSTLILIKEVYEKTNGFKQGGVYGWIKGGSCRTLMGNLWEAVSKRGIEVRLNTPVRNTIIKDGKVCGVEVDMEKSLVPSQFPRTEMLSAPIVVCTLPMWDIFKVVSPDVLPFWYVDWMERVQYKVGTWWAIHLGLNGPLDGWPVEKSTATRIVLGADHPRNMYITSNYNPSYPPEGEIQVSHFISADRNKVPNPFELNDAQGWLKHKEMFDLFEEDLRMLYPDMEKKTLWKTFHIGAYTLVEEPSISAVGRPYMNPPGVEGLYLVSDTMRECRGTGMQASARTALICVDHILGKK